MSKEREPGYYWVRLGDKWVIAEWRIDHQIYKSHWFESGGVTSDNWWSEIDETPIKRNDKDTINP